MPGRSRPAPKRVTVRLSPATHLILEQSAGREGISLAQYVREAALIRAAWEVGVSQDQEATEAVRQGFAWIRAQWEALGGFDYEEPEG